MKTSQNGEINHEYKTTDGSMGCLEPSVQIAQITDSYLHNVVTPDFFFLLSSSLLCKLLHILKFNIN